MCHSNKDLIGRNILSAYCTLDPRLVLPRLVLIEKFPKFSLSALFELISNSAPSISALFEPISNSSAP